jgi:MFS family permease
MALTTNGYLAAGLFGVVAAGVMAWNVLTMSMRQALIPQELFGRVQGAYRTLVWGAIPLGALTGGGLADALGIRWVFLVSGSLLLALAIGLNALLRRYRGELDIERATAVTARGPSEGNARSVDGVGDEARGGA